MTGTVTQPTSRPLSEVFDRFWAVVLANKDESYWERRPNRARWSTEQQAWLFPTAHYGGYVQYSDDWDEEVRDQSLFTPFPEDVAAVIRLLEEPCYRCFSDDPSLHLIAPDRTGEPKRYCLTAPDLSVTPGTGKKHYSGPHFEDQCSKVRDQKVVAYTAESQQDRRRGWVTVPGNQVVVWGRPANPGQIRDMDWCLRCARPRGWQREEDETSPYFQHYSEEGYPIRYGWVEDTQPYREKLKRDRQTAIERKAEAERQAAIEAAKPSNRVKKYVCPTCNAQVGEPCVIVATGRETSPHGPRKQLMKKAEENQK